ncbi:MAG TPA: zf-HC2 domain-containing protein [Thermoanaerobaculia bacterium]|nr:zf-HC2 domain-containing protein [Thermoanaerobaculia bacterium]
MRRPEDRGERTHQRMWDLLPWYANGTLPGEERRAVEDHLAACSRCREEVALCRATREALTEAGEIAPSPHPVQLARLLTRVDELESGQGRGRRPFLASLKALLVPTSPMRALLAFQIAVTALLVGLLLWQQRQPETLPLYRTLSTPEASRGNAARVRVLFAETATEKEIREILLRVHGEIVAGPSAFGTYTVEIPTEGETPGALLAHLRSQPQVRFAEPVPKAVGGNGP